MGSDDDEVGVGLAEVEQLAPLSPLLAQRGSREPEFWGHGVLNLAGVLAQLEQLSIEPAKVARRLENAPSAHPGESDVTSLLRHPTEMALVEHAPVPVHVVDPVLDRAWRHGERRSFVK